ncbi:MAG TPA: serine/threonine-protein kinase [Candidatus Sulfotelmatobacter sp.]|jgi:serine/threonine-protein kinase|nr:serine/threonine-protein kinase [Candidatus Sulfotelmatobacter sp.]
METPETKRFGRYEVVGDLGRGAMGIVYKARDPQIDRLVALKTVPLRGQEPEEEQEFRRRFLNEAQAAGRLHHPGIVSVFDVGEDPETHDPYIVLEYVAGEALNRMLSRERKLPLPKALQLVEELAEALDYAHAQGVIHRDIKPGNILITLEGHAKIADFGIAKLNLSQNTLPGKVFGTPAYMAPEQLSGEGVDGRSDLFSLGVILYAMLVGRSPFRGDNASTVCFNVANREPVPVSALDLNLPPELDAVVARAMAKVPANRYQRGAEFAQAVRGLREQLSPSPMVATAAAGKKKGAPGPVLSGRPAVGLAYAAKVVRAEVLKAPIKDLILGGATVILLLIVGVQANLLFSTHEEAADPGGLQSHPIASPQVPAPQTLAAQVQPAAASNRATAGVRSSAKSASAGKASVQKASTKPPAKAAASPALSPAREVVVPLSMVELAVRHQFKDATLFVWVDDKLALTRPLHGGTQKRLVVFNGVRGIESETLKVPAGKHVLRFQTQTPDQTVNLSKTISRDFIGGDDKTLEISFDKRNTAMHLDWQ